MNCWLDLFTGQTCAAFRTAGATVSASLHPTAFVADTGTAVTGPLRLSDRALEWLQSALFSLLGGDRVH